MNNNELIEELFGKPERTVILDNNTDDLLIKLKSDEQLKIISEYSTSNAGEMKSYVTLVVKYRDLIEIVYGCKYLYSELIVSIDYTDEGYCFFVRLNSYKSFKCLMNEFEEILDGSGDDGGVIVVVETFNVLSEFDGSIAPIHSQKWKTRKARAEYIEKAKKRDKAIESLLTD